MDPLDAPEPLGLLNRELFSNPLRNGPTLVAVDALVVDEEEVPWEELLEEEFFTVEPAPRREAVEAEFEEEFIPRRRSMLPAVVFGGALVGLFVGAVALVGSAVGAEGVLNEDEVVFVPPAPIAAAAPLEIVDQGESRRARRWVRRGRSAYPDRVAAVKAAPLSVRDLPALSVHALPRVEGAL